MVTFRAGVTAGVPASEALLQAQRNFLSLIEEQVSQSFSGDSVVVKDADEHYWQAQRRQQQMFGAPTEGLNMPAKVIMTADIVDGHVDTAICKGITSI